MHKTALRLARDTAERSVKFGLSRAFGSQVRGRRGTDRWMDGQTDELQCVMWFPRGRPHRNVVVYEGINFTNPLDSKGSYCAASNNTCILCATLL